MILEAGHRWKALAGAFLGWLCAGIEMSLLVAVTRPAIQGLVGRQLDRSPNDLAVAADEWFSWFLVAFLLGAAAGGALFGWLGDRFGRVRAMSGSILCFSLVTGASYFVQTPQQLLVLRFLACLGVGGMWPNGIALVLEVWPAVSRPLLAGLIGAAANVGFLVLGLAMLQRPVTAETWRWVMLFGAMPFVLGIWTLLAIPESPAWLESRNRIGAVEHQPALIEVFRPPLARFTLLGIALGTIPLLGGWASGQRLVPWAGQVASVTETTHLKAVTQIIQSIGAVIGSLLGGWFAHRLGARRSYFLISLVSLVLSGWIFGFTHPGETRFFVLTFALGLVGVSFFGWLPYYLPGLFPTAVRATGCGVAYNFGRILSAVAVMATAWLSRLFDGDVAKTGLATSAIYAAGLVLAWCVPSKRSDSA